MTDTTPTAGQEAPLTSMKVADLQALAAGLQIRGARSLRKGALIEAIEAARSSAEPETVAAEAPAEAVEEHSAPVEPSAPEAEAPTFVVDETPAVTEDDRTANDRTEAPASEVSEAEQSSAPSVPELSLDDLVLPPARGEASEQDDARDEDQGRAGQRKRGRGRGRRGRGADNEQGTDNAEPAAKQDEAPAEQSGDVQDDEQQGGRRQRGRSRGRGGEQAQGRPETPQAQDAPSDDETDEQRRSRGGRYRDRKRGRGGAEDTEPEIAADDVLLPIAGILDVLDNYAFVRTSGYLPGPNDVYVSLAQVKKYQLRKGDAVVGAIRQPREGENQHGRQKFNAIVRFDAINGQSPEEPRQRPDFDSLTALYPQERLRLETSEDRVATRLMDLFAPIGKGTRGLIVAPPKSGKSIVLEQVAAAVAKNSPDVHLMVVLIDERPEEVTHMQRTIQGEVVAATFDLPADDQTTVAELAIERAKRLVELGHDVVVLLDGVTQLCRAYNLAAPASGRILPGGVDASALTPVRRFFGSAKNVENGGSLTILATAMIGTGSKTEDTILESFAGTGNMELRLSRDIADKRVFPAIDISHSQTLREEQLLTPQEVEATWSIRRGLTGGNALLSLEAVLARVASTTTNAEFLASVAKQPIRAAKA
ncbi:MULTISPECIES: transcription termination factor Rho [unclassified Pseudoclavibacter]|uniref:transcription termination factor Rho n=1 Tax=unclassified Pseudoclavibacter TaxID=2615177 RepID=UPI000CE8F984|nr:MULTISPECIES: transcription termination factor Rho [unclassified Pseudoclavibacter]PPF39852.1 transcription termination factor Rho [Pseudoclavibacter sp. AY1H1]PPF76089.1 transcription termination factor Rho [Pseudoclavibacter sp. Z016]PPG02984.1 transcription termination factor Rho [Pseudoclavibacter sp. RFBI5]